MTEHPITPPSYLLQLWFEQHDDYTKGINELLIEAARYGADQELLACGNYLKQCAQWEEEDVTEFYNYRRPKPPSLKDRIAAAITDGDEREALKLLEELDDSL